MVFAAIQSMTASCALDEPLNPAAAVLKTRIMVAPEEIKWEACPTTLPAGARCATIEGDRSTPEVLFTYRLKMPDNYKLPPHFHPADEHLTVISGTFNMGVGEKFDLKATKPMTAGSFMVIPKGVPYFAWTRGQTIIQVHAIGPWGLTYVNPKDVTLSGGVLTTKSAVLLTPLPTPTPSPLPLPLPEPDIEPSAIPTPK